MGELWNGPIIDAHHHFWDPTINDHPWLAPEANIPFRYGDYSAIKRRYFPDDYFADAGDHRVVQTVYVETEWNPQDPIGETRFIEQLAARYGVPNAIVAQAWLDPRTPSPCCASRPATSACAACGTNPAGRHPPNSSAGCAA